MSQESLLKALRAAGDRLVVIQQLNMKLRRQRNALRRALQALADKVDSTSDCDHKRATCAEVGCIGEQVKAARKAIEASTK